MHGCSSTLVLLVNAEIDSMGGVVEGGAGIACKTSPRRAAIEKVQAELRQEYTVRDKTKRELEFLEKGGNPLDLLKPRNAASISVQSTSFTDQHPDQFITCEAKGSFANTTSPHEDSVESSGRLGTNTCEPNSADNIMLFDGEPEFSEGDRSSLQPSRSKIVPSEKLSQMDGSNRIREHGDSAAFGLPKKAYRRRYRSRPNRDGPRPSSTDVHTTRGSHGSSLPSLHDKDVKGLISNTENQNMSIDCHSKAICPAESTLHKTGPTDNQQDIELIGGKAVESTKNLLQDVPAEAASDANASETLLDNQCNQQSHSGGVTTPKQMGSDGIDAMQTMEDTTSAVVESQLTGTCNKAGNLSSSCQMTAVSIQKDAMEYDANNAKASLGMKGLESKSSCNQNSLIINGNNDGGMCANMRNADSNGKIKDQTLVPDGTAMVVGDEFVKEKRNTEGVDGGTLANMESTSAYQSQQENDFEMKPVEELDQSESARKNEVKDQIVIEGKEAFEPGGSEPGRKPDHTLGDNCGQQIENSSILKNQDFIVTSVPDISKGGSLTRISTGSLEAQISSCCDLKLEQEIDEDSILKEAQNIEAKRKRITELSVVTSPWKIRPKSHWEYVLEEMAWLANDFAQERVWKIAAAAQISCRAAFSCQLRKKEKSSGMEAKKIAHALAKSVMEFWHSVEGTSELDIRKDNTVTIQAYAIRFLKHNTSNVVLNKVEVPLTPDRVSDMGVLDLSWEDNLIEESLFYTVPPGAMETYTISIESHVAQCERIRSGALEEVEMSACDATADFESLHTAYNEEEETHTYDMSVAFEGSMPVSYSQKKRKHLIHAYGVRSYEVSSDIMQRQYVENKVVTQQSALVAKRPGGSLNVSVPTKRVRTASRRVISPFSGGTSGCVQVPIKTDSSGDTNSFQDDQTTLRGGSLAPNSLEVESGGDFNKQLPFGSAEAVTKHKKKKKPKHLNAAYESRWQADSTFQMEQRDNLKKSHPFDTNGSSGLFGQPIMKKPKIMRQVQDNSFENITSIGGSAPSPVASQMSNMSNSNKFVKMLGGRDRGRKSKVLKMSAGQLGSGNPWTLFEDQALFVLAHDLGPNWELVSDAINSTLQFKSIFHTAKECKERHNFLMDRTSGDGAESAEDSGSSQPYPSTLPGIPKGSARQLFQRLQGPMEEETLKSHFEKIIIIGQKQQFRKIQDPKQLQQPHSSHAVALSQVSPNNQNGGPVLTPLDLCDTTNAGIEILPVGFQGPHPGGIASPNQGTVTQMHPASGASSALQGSPNMMLGNNISSSPGSLNSSMRDVRYGVPRSASLSADEQQRMQQYNQMTTVRNIPQANVSSGALPGSGVRILPGSNAKGIVCGVNRSMPMTRPGFQGVAASSVVNSGSMVSSGMPSASMQSGVGSGQGSSMLRPREALHMMRPGLSQDQQRQMIAADLPMQVSPGNGQVPHFGGLSSPFPNQNASPPVSYPLHQQPTHPISPQQPQVLSPHRPHFQGPTNHTPNPQQQAFAIRLAKERQQQRFLQQPQFAPSSSLMPHVQSQPQLPTLSPAQNSPQLQPPTGSPPVSLSPLTSVSSMNSMPQHQQKQQTPTQGVVRNAEAGGTGLANQNSKQRQRQLLQANRQHPQQRQQPQTQQPAKAVKGAGRGNLMMHQNTPVDPSLVNGVPTSSGNQCSDKEETSMHLIPNQGSYTSPTQSPMGPTRQYASHTSNQSLPQQKNYSGQAASSTKHPHQMTSHSDNSSQGHVPAVVPGLSTGHQSVSPLARAGPNHQQTSSHQKLVNQNQSALQRLPPIRHITSGPSNKPQAKDSDADQLPISSSTEIDAKNSVPQTTNNTTNVAQVVSSASAQQRHASEPLLDPNALNSATNLSSSMPVPSNSGESTPLMGQGIGHRPSSASLPSTRHDVTAQWKLQQPSQLQHPNSTIPQHQQHQPSLPPLHSQQQGQGQGQLLQAGRGNPYCRSSDHILE
ncbi:hypothetical protein ACS0TY_027345 [Phlomoides rotata]